MEDDHRLSTDGHNNNNKEEEAKNNEIGDSKPVDETVDESFDDQPAANYETVDDSGGEDVKNMEGLASEHTYSASIGCDNGTSECVGGEEEDTEAASNLLAAVQELRDENQVVGVNETQEMRIVFARRADDDDHTNSTISTLETQDMHIKMNCSDSVSSPDADLNSINPDNGTLEWLNNSVAVAISNGVLPVTCKQLKGELHLNKFGSGNRGKCINAYSQWFTPTEFEAFAGRAQCKDWKRSIKFQERALLQLIELNILKVHAVSCTCPACWNGESSGPVRLHDTKRKTSSFNFTSTKREPKHDDDFKKHAKRARMDSSSNFEASSVAGPSIMKSPGGTLRLVSNSGGQQTAQPVRIVTQGAQGQQQTISLMLQPTNNNGIGNRPTTKQPAIYVSVPSSSTSTSASSSTIPVGVSYSPNTQTQTTPRRTMQNRPVIDVFEQLNGFEKVTSNLQHQVNELQSLIFGLRQKTEKAMQDMRQRTVREKDNEIRALKRALSQAQQGSQQEGEREEAASSRKMCENCNRNALMACGLCHQAFYCSEFCATKDMESHKQSCVQNNPVEMVNIE